MSESKRALLEEIERQEGLCDRCERRPKTHRCTCCHKVTLCNHCAADLFGATCPDCEEKLTRDD